MNPRWTPVPIRYIRSMPSAIYWWLVSSFQQVDGQKLHWFRSKQQRHLQRPLDSSRRGDPSIGRGNPDLQPEVSLDVGILVLCNWGDWDNCIEKLDSSLPLMMRCHTISPHKRQLFSAHTDRHRASTSAMVRTNTRWSYPHECSPWYEQPEHESMDLSPHSPSAGTKREKNAKRKRQKYEFCCNFGIRPL